MLFIFCLIFMAFMYAIKGGQHVDETFATYLSRHKYLSMLIDGKNLSSLLFFVFTFNPFGALGWFIGCTPSLGEEVPAIGGIKGNWVHENNVDRTLTGEEAKAARISALKRGLQRGVFMGACVAIGMQDFNFLYAGASWPLCVYVGISISQLYRNAVNTGWRTYEIVYGLAFGPALYFYYAG